MSVYNSAVNLNQDDTDMTMINPSFIYGGNDEPISSCIPIVRRLQQVNQSKLNIDDRNDNVYDQLGFVHQIEDILNFYRQDLKQDSKTQFDCNRQLIIRLVDFIRPIYHSDENQMKNLDNLYKEIFNLQEIRFNEQKEKNNQLHNEIRCLQKSFITIPREDNNRESLMINNYRINTMIDSRQWIEMEEETRQLGDLVKKQREQINQLIELVSSTEVVVEEKLLSNDIKKKCSICNDEFPEVFSEIQITNHTEKCLSKTNIIATNVSPEIIIPTDASPAVERLECPYCNEQLPINNEIAYNEHLSQCYNELNRNF